MVMNLKRGYAPLLFNWYRRFFRVRPILVIVDNDNAFFWRVRTPCHQPLSRRPVAKLAHE